MPPFLPSKSPALAQESENQPPAGPTGGANAAGIWQNGNRLKSGSGRQEGIVGTVANQKCMPSQGNRTTAGTQM